MNQFFQAARAANCSNDPLDKASAAKFGTAGVVIKNAPGRLYILDVVNVSATPYYLMIFDKATAPVNGDTPKWRRRLPASGELGLDFQAFGLGNANLGIGMALSSTDATLTLAVADDAHYAAQYK